MVDQIYGFCWHVLTVSLISNSYIGEVPWQKNLKQREAHATLHRALKFLRRLVVDSGWEVRRNLPRILKNPRTHLPGMVERQKCPGVDGLWDSSAFERFLV